MTMKEFLAQAGLRETGAMDDVAQAARDAATVLEVSEPLDVSSHDIVVPVHIGFRFDAV